MQHLSTDRLAALADETPTGDEVAHLAHCLSCRRERELYVALLELARREGGVGVEPGALAPVGDALTSWNALGTALRAEGLVDDTLGAAPAFSPARRVSRPPTRIWWRQAAAAVVLLAAGAGIGWASASAGLSDELTGVTASADAPDGGTGAVVGAPAFAGVSEAAGALDRAQREYQRAAAYLAEHDTAAFVVGSDALRTRLAALDEVIPRVREALADAPQDPVLGQYYLTTQEARETTVRQLGRTLPTGVRLTGY